MNVLLLIGAIATLACWIASIITRKNGTASDFQAHSSKFNSVLSSVYLGREALKKGFRAAMKDIKYVIEQLVFMSYQVKKEIPAWI